MNKLKSLTIAATTCAVLSTISFSSLAMDKYIEESLIDVCKSTMSNSVSKYRKTVKSYNLHDNAVALKVMCNGDNIIDFAQKHGAYNTASRLERSIRGSVSITDVAAIDKINVNFEE